MTHFGRLRLCSKFGLRPVSNLAGQAYNVESRQPPRLDAVEPSHVAYQRVGHNVLHTESLDASQALLQLAANCLEFDLLGTVIFSLAVFEVCCQIYKSISPKTSLVRRPVDTRCVQGCQEIVTLDAATFSFFRKVGSPEKLFLEPNAPLLPLLGRCRSFLAAHWSLVRAMCFFFRVLACLHGQLRLATSIYR